MGNTIMKYFEYSHLPANLKEVGRDFYQMAHHIATKVPDSAERTAGLRKLLEAKDCFVRASL